MNTVSAVHTLSTDLEVAALGNFQCWQYWGRRIHQQAHQADLEVAVIGDFQIGKSTFVNCLIGRTNAEMGRGVTTTHRSTSYSICNGVSVIDTPGFGAVGDAGKRDEQEAREAMGHSFAVIVYLNRPMGESCRDLVKEAMSQGKRCVFIFNCMNREQWSPEESEEVRLSIEAEVKNLGYADSVVKFGENLVHSINAQWALFGLGLLSDENAVKKIKRYARDDLKLLLESDLQSALLQRSHFLEVKRYIQNLPLEMISDFLQHKDREIQRIVNRFCEEFSKRMAKVGKG